MSKEPEQTPDQKIIETSGQLAGIMAVGAGVMAQGLLHAFMFSVGAMIFMFPVCWMINYHVFRYHFYPEKFTCQETKAPTP